MHTYTIICVFQRDKQPVKRSILCCKQQRFINCILQKLLLVLTIIVTLKAKYFDLSVTNETKRGSAVSNYKPGTFDNYLKPCMKNNQK